MAAAENLISWSLEHELAGGFPNSIWAFSGEVTRFKSPTLAGNSLGRTVSKASKSY